ncbi:hypothetical protein R1flu_010350 [Riccia fluitans]|uniref:Uncharacterized protein n=1 Tax=Riccia fluitans TaxID=41844 RepID=A0ABD1Z4R2_9MARC
MVKGTYVAEAMDAKLLGARHAHTRQSETSHDREDLALSAVPELAKCPRLHTRGAAESVAPVPGVRRAYETEAIPPGELQPPYRSIAPKERLRSPNPPPIFLAVRGGRLPFPLHGLVYELEDPRSSIVNGAARRTHGLAQVFRVAPRCPDYA